MLIFLLTFKIICSQILYQISCLYRMVTCKCYNFTNKKATSQVFLCEFCFTEHQCSLLLHLFCLYIWVCDFLCSRYSGVVCFFVFLFRQLLTKRCEAGLFMKCLMISFFVSLLIFLVGRMKLNSRKT